MSVVGGNPGVNQTTTVGSSPNAGTPASATELARSSATGALGEQASLPDAPGFSSSAASASLPDAPTPAAAPSNAGGIIGRGEQIAADVQHSPAFTTVHGNLGPWKVGFTPVAVEVIPFSNGLPSVQGRADLAKTVLTKTDFHGGDVKTQLQFRGAVEVRETAGATNEHKDAGQPNYIGPKLEMTETVTKPLNAAARRNAELEKQGLPPEPTGNNHIISGFKDGGLSIYGKSWQGSEFHVIPGVVPEPYYKVAGGVEKDFNVHFKGKDHTLDIKAGPGIGGDTRYAARMSPDFQAGFTW